MAFDVCLQVPKGIRHDLDRVHPPPQGNRARRRKLTSHNLIRLSDTGANSCTGDEFKVFITIYPKPISLLKSAFSGVHNEPT